MKFLFLTNTRHVDQPWLDASTRYRCYHLAEALLEHGHKASVAPLCNSDPNIVDDYDVLIMLRPPNHKKVLQILERCRNKQRLSIADYDDLIFRSDCAEHAPATINGSISVAELSRKFEANLEIMKQFDVSMFATETLRQKAAECSSNVLSTAIANGLSRRWLNQNRHLRTGEPKTQDTFVINYMPGSRSHDQDFSLVAEALAKRLRQHPEERLHITGLLNPPAHLIAEAQWQLQPLVNYEHLPGIISASHVSIAPLEDNAFNACKSHIKFIESAAFGTPVIATRIQDIARHQVPGLFALDRIEEWPQAMEQLRDKDYYHWCRQNIYRYVRRNCLASESAANLLTELQSLAHEHKLVHRNAA